MKFKITSIADIICNDCGGTTRVVPKKIYDTNDLACNCSNRPVVAKGAVARPDGTGVYHWLASWFKFN